MTAHETATDAFDPTALTWQKSSYSGGTGDCVELATAGEHVLIRDSKIPGTAPRAFPRTAITALITGITNGDVAPC